MNLVPPYDVMCLHRRISTSCLLSSLSRFSPPTRIPRGLRAGGRRWGDLACRRWWCPHRQQRQWQQQQQLHQVCFCGCGRQSGKTKTGVGGPTARVDRSSPPRPGQLNAVTVQWTGGVETCLFWMPIKITIWKRPRFCSVCGEASLLCWMSQVLSLIGTRGGE